MEIGSPWEIARIHHGLLIPMRPHSPPPSSLGPMPLGEWSEVAEGVWCRLPRTATMPPRILLGVGDADPTPVYSHVFAWLASYPFQRWVLWDPTPGEDCPPWWDAWAQGVTEWTAGNALRCHWAGRVPRPWENVSQSASWSRPWDTPPWVEPSRRRSRKKKGEGSHHS